MVSGWCANPDIAVYDRGDSSYLCLLYPILAIAIVIITGNEMSIEQKADLSLCHQNCLKSPTSAYGCLKQNENFPEENQFLRQVSNPEVGGPKPLAHPCPFFPMQIPQISLYKLLTFLTFRENEN